MALRTLKQQKRIMRVLQGFSVLTGLFMVTFLGFEQVVLFLTADVLEKGHSGGEWKELGMKFGGGTFFIVVGPLFGEFALTLQVASVLASDTVTEVVNAVDTVAPKSAEWETQVVAPALGLASGAVGQLSAGWSRGLTLSYCACWTMALGMFCNMLQGMRYCVRSGMTLSIPM